MPEVVMLHASSSTQKVELSNRVLEMRQYMEQAGVLQVADGFSDSESSSEEAEEQKPNFTTHKNLSTKHRHPSSKSVKTSLNEKRGVHRFIKHRTNSIEEKKKVSEREPIKHLNNTDKNDTSDQEEPVKYTFSDLQPFLAGQSKDDQDVPIMTPPPIPDPQPKFSFTFPTSAYARPLSLSFLHAGEKLVCGFSSDLNVPATETLLTVSNYRKNTACQCSNGCAFDDSLTGWERSERSGKTKTGRKRKAKTTTNDHASFLRLTGALNSDKDDPVAFQYYEDSRKYIERYRFFHAVGHICRPMSEGVKIVVPVKKDIENEPYFKNLKASCAMASECDLYSIMSSTKSKKEKQEIKRPASSKSSGSGHEKSKSEDEDSNEEGSVEAKPFSMRDRGKTLNLAPVRECMVPDLIPTDKFDQYQQNYIELNQYLNLMTPPAPGKNLQFQIDEIKDRRFGNRIINMGDNHLFPACTPRRGARPLRLGSAEFVKPGSSDMDPKWSTENKPQTPNVQRALTFHSSTLPGNLIVGSTISQSNHSAKTRQRHGGKSSPFFSHTKEQTTNLSGQKPHPAPHHVSGKKFQPCERVSDLTMSKERVGKFPPYSHSATNSDRVPFSHSAPNNDRVPFSHSAPNNDRVPPTQCRTIMAVDLKDTSTFRRDKIKKITLDVNHLGIRGKTFQGGGQINVLYKDRRTATVKS